MDFGHLPTYFQVKIALIISDLVLEALASNSSNCPSRLWAWVSAIDVCFIRECKIHVFSLLQRRTTACDQRALLLLLLLLLRFPPRVLSL